MKRYALLSIALSGLCTTAAQAQVSSPDNKIASVEIDGDTPEGTFYINAKTCTSDTKIEVKLQMLGSPAFLEVWRSNSSSTCHDATGRTATTMGEPPCDKVKEASQSPGASPLLTFSALDLFSSNGEDCDQKGTPKIYFVPLENQTADNATSGVSPGLGQPNYISFTVDVDPPPVPTSLSASPGENEIGVRWKSSDTSDTADGFNIYFDKDSISASGTDCTSERLVPGQVLEDDTMLTVDETGAGTTSTKIDPDSLDLEIGEQIAVAVAARDKAGNESGLSEIVCVERVPTEGFYDRYQAEGGNGLETCSAQAPGRVTWGGLSSLTLIALGLVWRRRRIA